ELQKAIQNGLRAQLGLQSIATGQLFVSLVLLPDTVPVTVGLEPSLIEIPTVPTLLQQFVERFEKVLAAVEHLPCEQCFTARLERLQGGRDRARWPEIPRMLRSVDSALADLQKFMQALQREVGPLVASLEQTSEQSRAVVKDVGHDVQQALADARPL